MTCTAVAATVRAEVNNPATGNRQIGYCWHVHDQNTDFIYHKVGLVAWTDAKNVINYNFYSAKTGLRVAGLGSVKSGQYNVFGWVEGAAVPPSSGPVNVQYSIADAMIMKFEGNDGAALAPGHYTSSSLLAGNAFHGKMGAVLPNIPIDPSSKDSIGPFCSGYDTEYDNDIGGVPYVEVGINVDLWMRTYCTFNTQKFKNIDFGIQASLRNVPPAIGNVNVDYSAGTHYSVTVGMGLHAVGKQRYMKATDDGPGIAYNLSEDYWEDYGNGTPAGVDRAITATILPDQATPPDGLYKDTVVLTLTHIAKPGDIPDDSKIRQFN